MTDRLKLAFNPSTQHVHYPLMLAYAHGEPIQWRNNGQVNGQWHELTDAMVRGEGIFTTMQEQYGSVWDWPWLEFRQRPVSKPFLRFKKGMGLILSYDGSVSDASYRNIPRPVARIVGNT